MTLLAALANALRLHLKGKELLVFSFICSKKYRASLSFSTAIMVGQWFVWLRAFKTSVLFVFFIFFHVKSRIVLRLSLHKRIILEKETEVGLKMKITKVTTYTASEVTERDGGFSVSSLTIIKVDTDEDISGIAEATLETKEKTVATCIMEF